MSTAAYLTCPSRRIMICLGRRLSDRNRTVFGFSIGNRMSSMDPARTAAVWAFLADTAGEELVVKFSDGDDFEEVAGYALIGSDEIGSISLQDYVRRFERIGEEARGLATS